MDNEGAEESRGQGGYAVTAYLLQRMNTLDGEWDHVDALRPVWRERSRVRTNNDLAPNCDGFVPSVTGLSVVTGLSCHRVVGDSSLLKNGGQFTTLSKAPVPSDHKSSDHKSSDHKSS